jgi:hypothetical protein
MDPLTHAIKETHFFFLEQPQVLTIGRAEVILQFYSRFRVPSQSIEFFSIDGRVHPVSLA